MIDYVTLMLINIAAAFFLLAVFLFRKETDPVEEWAPIFAITGVIALVTGFMMTFTWPLPGSYNMAFGELSVLFGALLAATSWHCAKGWSLRPLGIYSIFAGLVAIIIGAGFINLGLSKAPLLTGTGFFLAGIAGFGAAVYLNIPSMKWLRFPGAAVLVASAGIWCLTAVGAYWGHLGTVAK